MIRLDESGKFSVGKPIEESVADNKVELEYDDLEVTLFGPMDRDGDYEEFKDTIDFTYRVDKDRVEEFIGEKIFDKLEEYPELNAVKDDEDFDDKLNKYVEENFDNLFDKYFDEIIEEFREAATDAAENGYSYNDHMTREKEARADYYYDMWKDSQNDY